MQSPFFAVFYPFLHKRYTRWPCPLLAWAPLTIRVYITLQGDTTEQVTFETFDLIYLTSEWKLWDCGMVVFNDISFEKMTSKDNLGFVFVGSCKFCCMVSLTIVTNLKDINWIQTPVHDRFLKNIFSSLFLISYDESYGTHWAKRFDMLQKSKPFGSKVLSNPLKRFLKSCEFNAYHILFGLWHLARSWIQSFLVGSWIWRRIKFPFKKGLFSWFHSKSFPLFTVLPDNPSLTWWMGPHKKGVKIIADVNWKACLQQQWLFD